MRAGEPFACECAGTLSPWLACLIARAGRRGFARWFGSTNLCLRGLRGGLRTHAFGQRQRLVGALQEFHGHEDHLFVAEIFEIVHLELAAAISFVPGFAGGVGILDGGPVVYVLASAAAGHCGPEIIEHVTVESNALTGLEADGPHAYAIALRHQRVADAGIGIVLLPLELCKDFRRPR